MCERENEIFERKKKHVFRHTTANWDIKPRMKAKKSTHTHIRVEDNKKKIRAGFQHGRKRSEMFSLFFLLFSFISSFGAFSLELHYDLLIYMVEKLSSVSFGHNDIKHERDAVCVLCVAA